MPTYGKVKVDTITYDLSGTATDVSVADIATKASPTFTGTVTIPTPTAGDDSTKAASTAFVVASFATKASPTFTGTVTVPTPSANDNSTKAASTAYVQTELGDYALKASPTFTGDVTLNAQGDLRFADSDSSNWVAFQAPATVGSNVTWTLPAADGSASQLLTTNGSGTLSWSTVAGGLSSDAQGNTVGGTYAGDAFSGTDATNNTLIGYRAGTDITTGDYNTAVGDLALWKTTTGSNQTAVGYAAAGTCTTTDITAIGALALNIATGDQNTAVGLRAGKNVTSNTQCVFIGQDAGQGAESGCTGNFNNALGYQALNDLTSGTDNNCIGRLSGTNITTGNRNIGLGTSTVSGVTSGDENVGIGSAACSSVTTGEGNHGIGYLALYGVTTGSNNVGFSKNAGRDITTGDNNICIGKDAGRSNSPSGAITTGDNSICLGNDQISNLYCSDTSISSSDSRDKTDVNDFTHGLNWINQLKPVTYRWDKRAWYNEYNEDGSFKAAGTPDGSKKRERQHIGFLAQDVLAIEQADGFASKKDDMLVVNLNEDDTAYGLKYERLVPVLVNAIKELSTEVNTLKTKVAALEAA